MSGILDLLGSDISKTLINGTSKQLGKNKKQTTSALTAALPLILGAMKNNTQSKSGASGLLGALDNKQHDGSILDNLGGILGGSSIDTEILNDGAGILKNVFGGKQEHVARAVSTKSGLDMSSAMEILKVAAPLVMGYLGKEKRQKNIKDGNEIGDLLGGLLGGSAKKDQSMIEKILDADGDGSVIDDIIGMASGSKKSGGIAGMLKGFFGNR
jgi:hypothetical protein